MTLANKFLIVIAIASMFVLAACGADADETAESPTEVITEISNEETATDIATEEPIEEVVEEVVEEIETEATGSDTVFSIIGTDTDFTFDGEIIFSGDYTGINNDFSAFNFTIAPVNEFFPALVISGVPRSASEDDVIPLGNPVTETDACIFFQESLSTADSVSFITTSGSLTLTSFDGISASGTFEAVMVTATNSGCIDPIFGDESTYTSDTAEGNETYTLTGTFTDVSVADEGE